MKTIRAILKKADHIARDYFAPFLILDECGTDRHCWTMKEVYEWLPYCGKRVCVYDTHDYALILWRKQGDRIRQ